MKKLMLCLSIFALLFVFAVPAMAAGSGPIANAAAGAKSDLDLTQIGSKVPMSIIPQQLLFPQLIPYFGPENPGYRFWPLRDLLLYQRTFTIGSLQKNYTDKELRSNQLIRVTNPEALKQIMTVIYNVPANGKNSNVRDQRYRRQGYVGALVKGDYTSIDALRLMLLIANKMGAKVVHATRQGIDSEMYATGWGASLGGVNGSVSAEGDSGQVASGMLGWSTGKAGVHKDPWIQGIALEPVQ